MKTRFLGIVAFAIAGLLCYSCGDDEEIGLPSSPTQPTTESKGLVTFVLSLVDNSPVPTGTAPFVITTGDTLDMAISQTSSYTNPDGTVFTCEPKAYVKLFAQSDTLVAKDLQALTTVKELSVNTNEEKEAALTRHLTEQMFSVGGQIVTFNLSHEVYTYVNSQQESIEMPYIKVNPANYGSASADEKADGTHASAHLAGIRLKPIEPQTRGTLLTDTAMYEVTVAFNLDIKSVHTDKGGKQNLPFEVHFVALVESTTEVPDPVVEFSYLTKASEGTYSTVSPFVLAKGATSMTVDWEQQSSYTWFDLQRLEQCSISYGPQASITFSLAADTVTYSGTTEELNNATPSAIEEETRASESGSLHVARQTYTLGGGQTIGITWAYESLSSQDVQGNQIALPYVALDSPELLGVTVTERPDISIPGKEAAVYEVTARFKQDVSSQNATNNESQSMEYVIKYMAVQEVKLVKVTYRKGWEWNTPHDNIILGYFARVYRDRTYSNGKTFTDTFGDMGHFISLTASTTPFRADWHKEDVFSWDGKKIIYHPGNEVYQDSLYIRTTSIGVTDLAEVKDYEITNQDYYLSPLPGTWDEYYVSAPLNDQYNILTKDVVFEGSSGTSDKATGWYYARIGTDTRIVADYKNSRPPLTNYLVDMQIRLEMPDQYLVIDGQMITFLEFREEPESSINVEDITMPNGMPARVYTLEGRQHFLGKNFYVAAIDTVYQLTPAQAAATSGYPVHHSAPTHKASKSHTRTAPQLPPPYRNTPYVEYGGAPLGMKVPPMTVNGKIMK